MQVADSTSPEQNIHTTPEFLNHFHMGTAVTLQIPMGVGWSVTDFDEGSRLRYLKEAGICPNCGKKIPEGTAVVWGLGAFCSLECVAQFNQAEFSERARRLQAAARN